MHSAILDEDRTMNIMLPEGFYESSEDHVYPVLFIDGYHGDEFFYAVGSIVKHMASVTRMPETIVISFHNSITYGPDVYTNGMWTARDQLKLDADPALFVRHLEEELFPYLSKNFRATDYRMIMGVSGSSLFSLHSFARFPELFDAQMLFAAADMIGMGYKPGETFVDVFAERFKKSPQSSGQLYVSVAEDDVKRGFNDGAYQKLMDELEQRLSPYRSANFKLKVEIIPDEGHYDSILKGLLSALEMIFPKDNWSPKFRDLIAMPGDALENIDAWHQKRSAAYGFPILPKAERWNNVNCFRFIGGKLLRDGRVKEAVKVFERRLKYRPRSVAAMKSLAEALEADGQTTRANELNAMALEMDQGQVEDQPEVVEEIPESVLKQQFESYMQAQRNTFRKGATVADADALFDFYTPDFQYNHPKYGGYYSRELLYNNTIKYVNSGRYDNEPNRQVVNTIFGLNTVVVEQRYEGDEKTTMTLIKFRGDKIYYIEEYW
jgi:predicted alpha/beta superfamily hydrolase